jgi:hypothetical protein
VKVKPRLGDCAYGRFVAHALFARWDVEAPDPSDPGSGLIIRPSRLPVPDIVEARGTEPKLNSASAIRRTPTFVHRCGVQIAFVIVQERFVSYSGLIHGAKSTERLVSTITHRGSLAVSIEVCFSL